MLCARDVY